MPVILAAKEANQFVFVGGVVLVRGEFQNFFFRIEEFLQIPFINLRKNKLNTSYKQIFYELLSKEQIKCEKVQQESDVYFSFFGNFALTKQNL